MTQATTTGGYLSNGLWIKTQPSFYTPAQIARYLDYVKFSSPVSPSDIGRFQPSLEALEEIMRCHLLTFPWENTAMHYTEDHSMDVSPEGLYCRFVEEGKGSYCFGHTTILLGILRGLGFRVYAGAAKVNHHHQTADKPPVYGFLTHAILFVQPIPNSNETFIADVGFGSLNFARPVPLREGAVVRGAFDGEWQRLVRGVNHDSAVENANDSPHRRWHLEVIRYPRGAVVDETKKWKRFYSFTEEEFSVGDYEDASFLVSQRPGKGIFWNMLLCGKAFVDDDDDDDDGEEGDSNSTPSANSTNYYRLFLVNDEVKRYDKKGVRVVRVVRGESERLDVLREVFGVTIAREAVRYMEGRVPYLAE
ncbi:hypothetical protein CC1G_07803 [Coprinopsis cinerea okayama7|uniref:Uncharacterized protein n=2 Tax=Coprinopsis cinerea TaxID=5346 RepID=A8NP41_COPC7|nr:hypothetical protein CC1G_07803 [Coprinopsis cinerea okayama7\|eukprot:XP_001835260.2 hypothetical protein CC1G_07803 [Coprinopsis cinerea okayama7\